MTRATSSKIGVSITSLLLTAFLACPAIADAGKGASTPDSLADGFENPPQEARPRVWWHWMNGNITKDGIEKDLEWMKRTGIGGLQNFDASLFTPQIVKERLAYMTDPWKDAFRFTARKAEDLGLELTIAASPGWSETGGPWVAPKDGMKKVVWSELHLRGGEKTRVQLPQPPSTSGPFMDYPADFSTISALIGASYQAPTYYADIAVLAYPVSDVKQLPLPQISSAGKNLAAAPLTDGILNTGVDVARGSAGQPTVINIDYKTPQTVRTLTLFVSKGAAGSIAGPSPYLPQLEANLDGDEWSKIANLEIGSVPTTVSFSPVTARSFRVVFAPNPAAQVPPFIPAAGVDASVLAALGKVLPTLLVAELRLSGEARINRFESKAGYSTANDYYALDAQVDRLEAGVLPTSVIDLTGRMKDDGTLEWTPPAGQWRVVRLGYSLTGKTNHPATAEATGPEVDKYDGEAVRRYLEHYIGMYRAAAGEDLIGTRGVRAILTDSIEVGSSNWTPAMISQFERLRGYDPTPYLLALTGTVVGSRQQSDAFLYDFRRTLADLMASEHYGTVAKVAHEHGLKVYGEALESGRPSLGDDIDMRKYADYPMAALWTYDREQGPKQSALADMKGASSTAHIYGKSIVAAESLTSALMPWAHAPADLRRIVDLEFAHGITRPVIHTSVHQPLDDKKPGISLAIFGQYFTRHETWAEMARPWVDYLARTSYMLQQGRNVADVAYFYGEEAPLSAIETYFSDVPVQYAYDFVNADALLNVLQVDGNDLAAPSGARYKVLYLGGSSSRMTLPVLRRLNSLAEAGATIVGTAPTGSPGMDAAAEEYKALVQKLWSGNVTTRVGKGSVISSKDVEEVLASLGVQPAFSYAKPQPDSQVLFVHRQMADGDLYFVNNRKDRAERVEARFRVSGKVPEIWRADTGTTEQVSYRIENDSTIVPLELNAEDSFFVVFRKPAMAAVKQVPSVKYEVAQVLDGGWNVAFEPGRGAPANIELRELASLSEHADPGVKYFSGIATYTYRFKLPKGTKPGQPLMLDLGRVADLAEVRVNDQSMGITWHAPFRIDIGNAVRPGDNQLEVKVANLWVNRLIGDAQPGASKITFTALPTYRAEAPLRASGLLGPVRLMRPAAESK